MTMKEKRLFRQGDVLLIPTTEKAATKQHTEVPRDNGGVVLAYGEVTGHSHQFRDPGVCMLRREGVSDRVVIVSDVEALLVHEEHSTIAVPKGTYLCRTQVEWSEDLVRNVAD